MESDFPAANERVCKIFVLVSDAILYGKSIQLRWWGGKGSLITQWMNIF